MNSESEAPRSLRDIELEVERKVGSGCVGGWRRNFKPKRPATAGFFPQSGRQSAASASGADAAAHRVRRGAAARVVRKKSR